MIIYKIKKSSIVSFCLLFSLLFNGVTVFGQYDYRKGCIITNNNDTIYGYVEYENQRLSSSSCNFKKDSVSKPHKYTPNELKSVIIDDFRHYVSKEIDIEEKKEQVFLEYLIHGIINVYFYFDKSNTLYYFVEKDGILYSLTNEEKIKYIDGQYHYVKSNKYIGILTYLTKESPEALKSIKRMDFNHKSIVEVAKNYHNDLCDSMECVIYLRKSRKLNDAKLLFRVGMSFNYAFSKNLFYSKSFQNGGILDDINTYYSDYLDNQRITVVSEYFYPGLFINITPSWQTSLQLEFYYYIRKIVGDNLIVDKKSLSVPLICKRNFCFKNKISPYIELGLVCNYHFYLNSKQSNSEQSSNTFSLNTFEEEILSSFQSHFKNHAQFNLAYGCGIDYKLNNHHRINLGLRKNYDKIKTVPYIENIREREMFLTERSISFKIDYSYLF